MHIHIHTWIRDELTTLKLLQVVLLLKYCRRISSKIDCVTMAGSIVIARWLGWQQQQWQQLATAMTRIDDRDLYTSPRAIAIVQKRTSHSHCEQVHKPEPTCASAQAMSYCVQAPELSHCRAAMTTTTTTTMASMAIQQQQRSCAEAHEPSIKHRCNNQL
jgi:hypothetical protein